MSKLIPGTKVRFTVKWLRSVGLVTERQAPYTVLECSCALCKRGRYVVVDELNDVWYTKEELKKDPWLKWRHILVVNLQEVSR